MHKYTKDAEILIVDDNAGDAELITELLKRSSWPAQTHSVRDGAEAMAFLRCEGTYSGVPRPHLILLDLNMPRKDGWAVLTDAKSDIVLKKIPIVVFTTSAAMIDIVRCYELGANSYVTKPGNLGAYTSAVATIGDYWFGVASLAQRGQNE
jgi:chemotaxis family two-component system response regulator Rcp1